ncbi:hypothetical protein AXG93_812s1190 [Marchantia polymorpha subsp. ruderalis]|uniref:Uncharacterized protein n=1 Tax=Marchantia polymorpha subsp. ruderalis TaxID=1480154 RepID=A0A176VXS2_MARPO|nr:hypothetical protein AXG93_812s1190 [Marchantia polymorpha subsp. ruderalis]
MDTRATFAAPPPHHREQQQGFCRDVGGEYTNEEVTWAYLTSKASLCLTPVEVAMANPIQSQTRRAVDRKSAEYEAVRSGCGIVNWERSAPWAGLIHRHPGAVTLAARSRVRSSSILTSSSSLSPSGTQILRNDLLPPELRFGVTVLELHRYSSKETGPFVIDSDSLSLLTDHCRIDS